MLLFVDCSLHAQPSTYPLIKQLEQKSVFIESDLFGNIYLSDGNVIYKFNEYFQAQQSYSDFFSGKIQSVDATNPMKILVFSKDFMRLTFLNNQMAKQNNPYLLTDWNILLPTAACTSYDNGFWIYDAMKDVLLRFNASANKVLESQALSVITGEKITPDYMREIGGKYVVLCSKEFGFFVFDKFGTFLKSIPAKGIEGFSVWNSKLVYISDHKIYILTIETLESKSYTLPEADVKQLIIQGKYLIALSSSGIVKIYGFAE